MIKNRIIECEPTRACPLPESVLVNEGEVSVLVDRDFGIYDGISAESFSITSQLEDGSPLRPAPLQQMSKTKAVDSALALQASHKPLKTE